MSDPKRPPGPPSRNLISSGKLISAGARKEELRRRAIHAPGNASSQKPLQKRRYAELRSSSAFSFLEGSALPEDLIDRAAALELPAVALIDTNGVYGAPRFYKAAKGAGVKALVGAEVVLIPTPLERSTGSQPGPGPLGLVPPLRPVPLSTSRLTLLVESQAGYRNLCRLVTLGSLGSREPGVSGKRPARVTWEQVAAHAEGLHLMLGNAESPLWSTWETHGIEGARRLVERLSSLFPGRLHLEIQRHGRRSEEHRNQALCDLGRALRLPVLATNGVRYARPKDKELFDVLTCLRHHTTLDAAGQLLDEQRERHLKSGDEMATLFGDLPGVLEASADLADRLSFTLADLGYRFPAYPLPSGETPSSFLRRITWEGARSRFHPLTGRAQAQLTKELALIEKLDLAGYFLIVWDIVEFCRKEKILVQGRGSAANSAVCYALSITAVDPVKMELLFERFLSEERGEWPDIDLDLPSGDQREKVIQHVYKSYGPHGAAMTANVITYRDRSAAREVAKVLGFSPDQVDRLAKQLGKWSFGEFRDGLRDFGAEVAQAGFDAEDLRILHFKRLWIEAQNLPRHLGQHSGGIVVAMGRLDEVVPLEPAAMPGRVVIQWDKDDCADLGIVKVDLLGLGMLGAIEEMIPLIEKHEGVHVDLAHLPQDDPAVFSMLNAADTIGLFQVESRAQMASLPLHAPKTFYDIVVQVAIIRPGPIVGGMVHPFFDRRRGLAPVTYAHPSLEPILKRTLGIPLFQEQLLRIAMVAAGFTGGEAEELRRAMGFKRSQERMAVIEKRLRDGMAARGITSQAQEEIVRSITAFALYGFPESHAASFALIAYASGYLKAHHPASFYAALLNAWPMGFYHPATIVKDAERHGTPVLPIDVNRSGWGCRVEGVGRENAVDSFPSGLGGRGGIDKTPTIKKLAFRLGLRFIKGLRRSTGEAIEHEQALAPFHSTGDLMRRVAPREHELDRLAFAGAFSCFGLSRRAALWQVADVARPKGPLFTGLDDEIASPLPEMSAVEETLADYGATEMTAGPHLLAHLRAELDRSAVLPTAALTGLPDGQNVRTAGAVIVRQRPGTAKGFVFLSLEDETGICQAIVRPDLFRDNRALLVGATGLIVEGRLQNRGGTLSVKAEKFWPLPSVPDMQSHDFH